MANTLRFHRLSRSDFNSNTTRTYNKGDLYFIYENTGTEGVIYMCKTAGKKSAAAFEQYSVTSFQSLTMTGAGKTVTFNPEDGTAKFIDIAAGSNVSITDNSSTANALKLKINSVDTKNTAGATNSADKLFIVGATAQGANPQTYSNAAVYEQAGTLTATSFVKSGGTSSQFLKADGSVSTHSGMDKVGTVTSVAASAGAGIGVSGSPITSSGTLTITNTGVRSVTAGSTANVIKVNTNGTDANITINNVAHATSADSATNATNATTATNLANKPALTWSKATTASAGSTLTVTAGGKTSDAITIDKVRSAFTADSATTATNLANKPVLTWTDATSTDAGSTLTVTAGGKTSDTITIGTVRLAQGALVASKAVYDGGGNEITKTYVKKSGDTMTGALTATSFVKSGGTATQFLMANGSVKTLSTTVTQNDANPVSGGAVWSFCDEFEEVTATALNYLNLSKQDKLTAGSGIALTQASGSAIISVAGVPREVLSATYAGLVQLRNNNRLVPGQWYRITDYVTTTKATDTQSAGHPFDIIVAALDTNKLSETAFAIQSVRDTDGYFSNSKLTAWQLWYCLDNDTSRFDWTDATNGKGVIYRMIDEYDNDCPYDFKNIQFKRYKVTDVSGIDGKLKTSLIDAFKNSYISTRSSNYTIGNSGLSFVVDSTDFKFLYTFSAYDQGAFLDDSLIPFCRKNKMGTYYNSNASSRAQSLNNNVFCDRDGQDVDSFFGNTFKENCHNNTCWGYSFYSNTFGNYCYGNTFGNSCYSNTFGNWCNYNIFANNCDYNIFGNNCSSNTFGNSCYSNIFGNSCDYNTFSFSFQENIFGNNCDYNIFGNNCFNNTFGNQCKYINFASSGSNRANRYNYYRNNHFGDGCQYIVFTGTATASSTAQVQNYNFAQGINSVNTVADPAYKTVSGARSRLYQTYVVTNTSNAIKLITISNTSVTVS